MTPRFSLAECNAMLPLVRAISAEIMERRRQRSRLVRRRDEFEHAPTPEGLSVAIADLSARICEAEDGIHRACQELERHHLTVLRINPLVVHFPGRTQGDDLVFCWQEDDATVSHGHPSGQEEEPRFPLKLRQ